MTDHATLRSLAERATPGPWVEVSIGHHCAADAARVSSRAIEGGVTSDLSWIDQEDPDAPHVALAGNGPNSWNNGKYIAALSPDVTLALLDELETLRTALGDIATMLPGSVPLPMTEEQYLRAMLHEVVRKATAALAGSGR